MDDGRKYKLMSPEATKTHFREDVTIEFRNFARATRRHHAYLSLCLVYVSQPWRWQSSPLAIGEPPRIIPIETIPLMYKDAPLEYCYRMTLETAITRTVELFNYYLARLFYRVFTERPETLRTESVPVKDALECATRDELVAFLAEKKVTDLGHNGLPEIVAYLNNSLGLGFDKTMGYFVQACAFMEVRNLIVHHGGIVTNRFVQRTHTKQFRTAEVFPIIVRYSSENANFEEQGAGESPHLPGPVDMPFRLGDVFPLTEAFYTDQAGVLEIIARAIDGRFINKFRLMTVAADNVPQPD